MVDFNEQYCTILCEKDEHFSILLKRVLIMAIIYSIYIKKKKCCYVNTEKICVETIFTNKYKEMEINTLN